MGYELFCRERWCNLLAPKKKRDKPYLPSLAINQTKQREVVDGEREIVILPLVNSSSIIYERSILPLLDSVSSSFSINFPGTKHILNWKKIKDPNNHKKSSEGDLGHLNFNVFGCSSGWISNYWDSPWRWFLNRLWSQPSQRYKRGGC